MSIQLASDIEGELRAEAAARGMDVDALITTAVKAYLREVPKQLVTASRRGPSRDRSAEMAWAASPDVRFIGKWAVLEGARFWPVARTRNVSARTCGKRESPRLF